jgi:protein-disulfide isomerase
MVNNDKKSASTFDEATIIVEAQEDVTKRNDVCQEKNGQLRKQRKSYIALIVLLGGIAGGALFIDVVQLFAQKGFSARGIKDAQVIEYDGSTWVRYDDPKIVVDFFDADDCPDCVTDEVLMRLRSYIPTLEAHRIDVRTEEGKKYAQKEGIKYIPAFLFAKDITESDFYQQAAILFKEAGQGAYFFDAPSAGVPIGEYITQPSDQDGIQIGNAQAPVTIIAFDDFSTDESRVMFPIIEKLLGEFGDRVRYVVKPLSNTQQAMAMKLAQSAVCANEQGKYQEFMRLVTADYRSMTTAEKADEKFNAYITRLHMDAEQFHGCLAEDRVKEIVTHNDTEAAQFGVVATPTYFINGRVSSGVATYETVKGFIDDALNSSVSTGE